MLLPPQSATLGPAHPGELKEGRRRQALGWTGNGFVVGAAGREAAYTKGSQARRENAAEAGGGEDTALKCSTHPRSRQGTAERNKDTR